jgi:hypothetical protein
MGAEPYSYFVEYQPNVQRALDELREREFQAGRYFPAMESLSFPLGSLTPSPGAKHRTIREAREAAGTDGTRSILDIASVGEEPDYSFAAPVDDEALEALYGTTRPTRKMVETNMDFLVDVDRGQCVYIITYENDRPDGIVFAGYTFD